MDETPRRLTHPGPPLEPRVEVVAGRGVEVPVTLAAGLTLHEAIARAMAEHGLSSAVLSFRDAVLDPLVYFIPFVVEGAAQRFQYSPPVKPDGGGRIEIATVTFGRRDGDPFSHCHALWEEADGQPHGGHVVPTDSVLAADVPALAWGLPEAAILSEPDAETGYTLFHPVRSEGQAVAGGRRMAAVRVKPNEDLCAALERVCLDEGFREAIVRGGVGSLIGARFADGSGREDMASEVLVTAGRVAPDETGRPVASLDVGFSGFSGLATRGRLLRGRNPVCMTFELLLDEGPAQGA